MLHKLVANAGLTPSTKVLDIGCGTLRLGRNLIPFLDPGNYHGIEPAKRWLDAGIKYELTEAMADLKQPTFYHNPDFEVPEGLSFDLILALQVFIHCSPRQLKQCLSNVQKYLAKGGIFVLHINFSSEDEEIPYEVNRRYEFSDNKSTFYNEETLDKILSEHGFKRTDCLNMSKVGLGLHKVERA